MIDGFKIELGGQQYVVPPLNLKSIKKALPLMMGFTEQSQDKQIDIALDVFLMALNRNYPEAAKDQFEEDLDWSDFQKISESLNQLFSSSGLVAVDPLAQSPQTAVLTGDGSTDTSSQAPDGPGQQLTN